MGDCRLNFSKEDNVLAFDLYEGLTKEGVSCAEMDIGYSEINSAGIHCPDKNAKSCVKGKQDGIVNSEEVFEYGLNHCCPNVS